MAGTKGMQTRQRIVELAAPVFNRQGYVGASMRDLIGATGLEKGGIYNHFGSKEQLALEAYDYALSRVTDGLARSQDGATDAVDRLQRMIQAFAKFARKPAIAGGCPIMNTAIEADDTHPELRDRAQRVDDAVAPADRTHRQGRHRGRARSSPAPTRTRSPRCSPARSKAGSCSRGSTETRVHRPGRRPSRPRTSSRCAPDPRRHAMTALEAHTQARSRKTACAAARSRGPIPRSRASAAASLTGYERLVAMQRGELAPPPAAALLGLQLDEVEPGRTVFSMLADEVHENPMGTMHGGIVATLVDTAMGCALSSRLPADAGFTTLELKTNYVRAITQATGRVYAEGTVVHSGGRVATTEARVHDANGTLYAHATSTCLILRGAR